MDHPMNGGAMSRPILTAAVGLANVRFFAPLDDTLPFVALDDVCTALGLGVATRQQVKASLQSSGSQILERRETADGLVAIVPAVAALAFILHAQSSFPSEGVESALMRGCIDAYRVLNPGLSLDQFMATMNAAVADLGGRSNG